MFQDVNVKFQVHSYLKFDVDVLKHAFFLWIVTFFNKHNNAYNSTLFSHGRHFCVELTPLNYCEQMQQFQQFMQNN